MKKKPAKRTPSRSTGGKKTKKVKRTTATGTSSTTTLVPIPKPSAAKDSRIDRVYPGQPISPIVRVRTFSADEWEDFIQEWVSSLKSRYHTVMRCSGAGDMGRDVVAHTGKLSSGKPWDNYQCKHYDHALRPSDIWVELGKLVYYTCRKEFSVPRRYFFVAPHDVGTTLARLLERPNRLQQGLVKNWDAKCRNGICSEEIPLDGTLTEYIEAFPFKIVSFVPVLKVIEQHRTTPWYVHRFGGGLPDRPKAMKPPNDIGTNELRYISELMRAYSDYRGTEVDEVTLSKLPKLKMHYLLSRASFYSAESLKAFSRDHLPENEYGRLQDEINDGVQETYLDEHENGYRKVLAVTKAAVELAITDHPLLPVLQPPDRRGICHQLVDMQKLRWVESNGRK